MMKNLDAGIGTEVANAEERKAWAAKADSFVDMMKRARFVAAEDGCGEPDCSACNPTLWDRTIGHWWTRTKMVMMARLLRSLPLSVVSAMPLKMASHFHDDMMTTLVSGQLFESFKEKAQTEGTHFVVFTPWGFAGVDQWQGMDEPVEEVVVDLENNLRQSAPPQLVVQAAEVRRKWLEQKREAEKRFKEEMEKAGFTLDEDTPVAGRA